MLRVLAGLLVQWNNVAKINGQRIEGSVKVSNQTGDDFDLTAIVLAVNDIGRATAIGYQHFSLKHETIDFEIPFGETAAGRLRDQCRCSSRDCREKYYLSSEIGDYHRNCRMVQGP